ncbi:hypothetical protein NXX19_07850 [Bacteroides ovatus]|nr:hypothetical protein [Bacteroides ovatus]
MSADQISASRFPGFRIGDFTTYSKEEETGNIIATQRSIHPAKVVKDKLNYAATLRATYNVTGQFGLTADGTVATRFPRINEYAGTGPYGRAIQTCHHTVNPWRFVLQEQVDQPHLYGYLYL